MEALCDIIEIACSETRNRNAAVTGQVDSVFFTKCVNHVFGKASVSEHADLTGAVAPVMLVAKFLKLLNKANSHVLHAARHHDKIVVPHLCQLFIA